MPRAVIQLSFQESRDNEKHYRSLGGTRLGGSGVRFSGGADLLGTLEVSVSLKDSGVLAGDYTGGAALIGRFAATAPLLH